MTVYDEEAKVLRHTAGSQLPSELARAIAEVEIGPRNGSCAAAIFLERQVIVAEIARDACGNYLRKPALAGGLRSCWSTPIRAPDGRMVGTVAMYFRQPRSPLQRDFELMARLHGARRDRDRAQARRAGDPPQRGALPRAVRKRDRGRVPLDDRGPLRSR